MGARAAITLLVAIFCASSSLAAQDSNAIHFWWDARLPLGKPDPNALVNENASPRIHRNSDFETFYSKYARALEQTARDPRVRLNPNFIAALVAKESGFDPNATSHVPANGLAQITHIADADMLIITRDAPAFQWMHPEVSRWPRHPVVHRADASKAVTDSLLKAGTIRAQTEYLFDPNIALRAGTFWLRILATIWLEDEWPGMYGTFARKQLNGGEPQQYQISRSFPFAATLSLQAAESRLLDEIVTNLTDDIFNRIFSNW